MAVVSLLDMPAPGTVGRTADADLTATLIQTRQQLAPKRLFAPRPEVRQIHAYFQAAAAAPDHGQILPWRFVVVPAASRAAHGDVFAQALRERDASASGKEQAEARDKVTTADALLAPMPI